MDNKPKLDQAETPTPLRRAVLFLFLLGLLTAAVRVPGVARPLLGNFATKNVVYGMIARNWDREAALPWVPTLDLLSDDGRPMAHLLEYPVSVLGTVLLGRTLGGSLEVWGRVTSIAFSIAAVLLFYGYLRRRYDRTVATVAAVALALSPVSIIYGQSFMLEPSVVFFTIATFWSLDRLLDGGRAWWIIPLGLAWSLLLLTKGYMFVLVIPISLEIECRIHRRKDDRSRAVEDSAQQNDESASCAATPASLRRGGLVGAVLVLGCLPSFIWYAGIVRTTQARATVENISGAAEIQSSDHAVYYSISDSLEAHKIPSPLLWSPKFYAGLFDDLTGVVLTPLGFFLLLAGFLARRRMADNAWLASMALLVLLLPRKFHEANYYFLVLLPPLCLWGGLGWRHLSAALKPSRKVLVVFSLLCFAFSMRYALKPAFVTPEEDRAVLPAAEALDGLTTRDEPIVTMHGTGIDLLYYCDRRGWVLEADSEHDPVKLKNYRRHGVRYLVTVGHTPDWLSESAPVTQGTDFAIYSLADL